MKPQTKDMIKRLLLSGLVIALIVAALWLVLYLLGWTDLSQEELQEIIASAGVAAPLCYILISFLQVTFVPIPGAVTVVAGCYVFGWWRSLVYSYIGMMAGSMLAFWLGKKVGRPFVNWLMGGQDKTEEWLLRFKDKEKVLLFFMFLFPGFPDDLLCSVAGILPITWGGFFLMQLVTRLTSIGATVLLLSGDIIPYHGWGLIFLACLAAVGLLTFIICFKHAGAINRYCMARLEKLSLRLFPHRAKSQTDKEEGHH